MHIMLGVIEVLCDRLLSASALAGCCVSGFRYHCDQTPWVL